MRAFSFEKLKVWQKSRELAKDIYILTSDFPNTEKFGLTNQMRRCSISIASNIAEGSSRHSNKDKARYTEIAYGSGLELLNQLIISLDIKLIDEKIYKETRTELTKVLAMLDGLYRSQIK